MEVAYNSVYQDKIEVLLSWEWYDQYALRSSLYPLWLSIPARILKMLYLDSNILVVNSMYMMHCILWVVGDFYFFKLAKEIGGTKCACFTTMVSLTNQTVNRFVSKASTNGIEGALAIASFYYYIKTKPKVNDGSLNKMTFFITIAFIIRSSSLAPWIPLAILKIFENPHYFMPFVNSAFVVTLPMILASIALDSWYYGVFTVPQLNFLRVNVVENLSKHFWS